MSKMVVAMLAGVFVGAFVVEVLNRKRPGLMLGLEHQAEGKVAEFKRAFDQGFAEGATQAAG